MAASSVYFLEDHQIEKAPPTAYYIPDFISEQEEKALWSHIYSAPKPKWKQLSNRRLQNWGGLPHPKGMLKEPLPPWLEKHTRNISNMQVFDGNTANHVLVNEYKPGQGIMPHTDGPLFYPTISTINLGSPTLLKIYKSPVSSEYDGPLNNFKNVQVQETRDVSASLEDRFVGSLLLMPRSLLILKDSLYVNYYHGIDEVTKDTISEDVFNLRSTPVDLGSELERETRISLTIRYVPKTLTVKFPR